MLDPKLMDEQLGIDRSKLADRYKRVQEPEQQQATPEIQFQMSYDDVSQEEYEREGIDEAELQKQMEEQARERAIFNSQPAKPRPPLHPEPQLERPSMAAPNKAAKTDKPMFEGGPLESEVLAWKKQFGRIYQLKHEGRVYIWRPMNRFEYKEIMSIPNTNELMREEMICEVCVLFPYDYSYATMVNDLGGLPSLLAENIMQKSGFTRRVEVVAL